MWRYHLTSTPWRAGVTSGVLFGIIMAAPVAWQLGPLYGLVGFILGGTIFGALIGLNSREGLAPLAGLSLPDRATVMSTVQRGAAITDRSLAPAVVGYIEATRRRTPAWAAKSGGARLFYALAAFQLFQAMFNLVERDWTGVGLYTVLGVFALFLPRLNIRAVERRDRAERSARALLEEPG